MEQTLNNDITSDRVGTIGIVRDKAILYVALVLLFFGVGVLMGAGTINYFKPVFFPKELGHVATTTQNSIWSVGSILFYAIVASITLGSLYLFHQMQRRLSINECNNARWTFWADCAFTALNTVCCCGGIICGIVGALIYTSYALGAS